MLEELGNIADQANFTKFMGSEKDYDKYVYFISRAKNCGFVIKSDRKQTINDEPLFTPGMRVEFKNKMIRLEKDNELDKVKIDFLRGVILKEKDLIQIKKTIWEETKPEKTYTEAQVKEILKNHEELLLNKEPKSNTNKNTTTK
jgi:hypothetical protein